MLGSRAALVAFLAVPALVFACGQDTASGTSESDVIGGIAARGGRLDAIGSLVRPVVSRTVPVPSDGGTSEAGTSEAGTSEASASDAGAVAEAPPTHRPFCTATLIAPRLVITAKHCVKNDSDAIFFAVGGDGERPKRTVRVARTWLAPLDEGGFVSLGADVALLALEERITDVEPLAVLRSAIPEDLVGGRFSAVGFGLRDRKRTLGLRQAATLTLRATRGQFMKSIFESDEALVDFTNRTSPEAFRESDVGRLRDFWNRELLPEYEAYLGLGDGDAQPCSGDSGGPLVARMGDRLVVSAVVSGSFKLGGSSANPCSVLGEMYATLGPVVQTTLDEAVAFVDGEGPERVDAAPLFAGSKATLPAASNSSDGGADPCLGLPTRGICVEGAALRCLDYSEGPVHATRTDCTLLAQRCVDDGDTGARCEDE